MVFVGQSDINHQSHWDLSGNRESTVILILQDTSKNLTNKKQNHQKSPRKMKVAD